jgi:hypothetical protein
VGNTTTAILANLVAGSTYYFAATSCDATGNESGYSNEAVYSVPATTTVPPLVALASPAFSGGNFSFAVPGAAGTNVAVEASVDLINWVPVQTNTPPFTFVDTNARQFTKRFYRTVNLP